MVFIHSKKLFFALIILVLTCRLSFAQDAQPTLESILALTEPPARIAALQKFIQAQRDDPQAETARAELTRMFAFVGESQLAEKNIDAGLQSFKQAIASLPKKVDDQFFEDTAGRIPFAVSTRGYRTEAILLARELEARFSSEANRLAGIGEFYLSVEAPVEALRALNAAVKLAPNDARIYRMLGGAYRQNLDLDKATAQYQSAIKADPNDRRAYFELANFQRARNNFEAAVNLFKQQLTIDPQHVASLKGLAITYVGLNKESLADDALAQAAKISKADLSQDTYLQTQLALAYLARGNVKSARRAADAAVSVEPRFSWARIAAAEVDLAEGKYFDAERHILAAMRFSDFPTLYFTLGKIYLAVEDFDGAIEQLNKSYTLKAGKFQTKLGGVLDLKADSIPELLARERQSSLFQSDGITTSVEYKLAENLTKFDDALRSNKRPTSSTISSMVLSQASNKLAAATLEKAANEFAETEGSRKPFRWLYAADRLLQTGQSAEASFKLSEQALDSAESATAPDHSLQDFPNYDRDGRLRIFRGRALTLRGRSLLRMGRKDEALKTLEEAVDVYGILPERKKAQWQLATAKESSGQIKEALDLYITAYEAPDKSVGVTDFNRAVIESVYRKVNGSLIGLDERIGRVREANAAQLAKNSLPALPVPESAPVVETPVVTAPASTPPVEVAKQAEPTETKVAEPVVEPIKTEAKKIALEPLPVLPTLKAVALALNAEEAGRTDLVQEIVFEDEDAPLVEVAKAEPLAPARIEAPVKTLEALPGLPTLKSVALALNAEEAGRTNLTQEIIFDHEDAPLPTLAKAETPPPVKVEEPIKTEEKVAAIETPAKTEDLKPLENPDPVKTANTEIIAAPLEPLTVLPKSPTVPYLALPSLEESSVLKLNFELAAEDDSPLPVKTAVVAAPKAETVAIKKVADPANEANPVSVKVAPQPEPKISLSDSRAAEIEQEIEASRIAAGGKKGDSANAVNAAVSGHSEGDKLPVRASSNPFVAMPKTAIGESGHSETQHKTIPKPEADLQPGELERRASDMGKISGRLSVEAANEIEIPDKPVGVGRKGNLENAEPDPPAKEEKKPGTRPRRVKDQ